MFSVITITYNRRTLLEKAIRSVLNQTHTELEHIIVDDGSTDDTQKMIANLNDKRLRYMACPHTGRLSSLRNTGLVHAKGKFVVFLDSDDFFEPGYLQRLYDVYSDPTIQSAISNAHILSASGRTVLFKKNNSFQDKKELLVPRLKGELVIYPSCFSFRQKHLPPRFMEHMKIGDSDLFLRLISEGASAVIMDPLVNIVKHASNMSENRQQDPPFIHTYAEELETLKALKDQKKISAWLYHSTRSAYLYKLGRELQKIQHMKEARENYWKAFYGLPLNLRALAKLLLSFA